MNLLTMEQGKGRFVMMDDSMWGMILGKSGKIPGTIDPELVELAKKQGREFTDVDAHTLLTNALDDFKKVMGGDLYDNEKVPFTAEKYQSEMERFKAKKIFDILTQAKL